MTSRADLSSVAKVEADYTFLSFSQYTTIEQAQSWYQGLIKAISTFKTMPRRCAIARENDFYASQRTMGDVDNPNG